MFNKIFIKKKNSTSMRFELTRENPIRFQVWRLNHSATTSVSNRFLFLLKILFFINSNKQPLLPRLLLKLRKKTFFRKFWYSYTCSYRRILIKKCCIFLINWSIIRHTLYYINTVKKIVTLITFFNELLQDWRTFSTLCMHFIFKNYLF